MASSVIATDSNGSAAPRLERSRWLPNTNRITSGPATPKATISGAATDAYEADHVRQDLGGRRRLAVTSAPPRAAGTTRARRRTRGSRVPPPRPRSRGPRPRSTFDAVPRIVSTFWSTATSDSAASGAPHRRASCHRSPGRPSRRPSGVDRDQHAERGRDRESGPEQRARCAESERQQRDAEQQPPGRLDDQARPQRPVPTPSLDAFLARATARSTASRTRPSPPPPTRDSPRAPRRSDCARARATAPPARPAAALQRARAARASPPPRPDRG